jgi:hypothetical protein
VIRRTLLLAASALAVGAPAAHAALPFQADSIGPISDVTAGWQYYQPANVFCIQPDGQQLTPGGAGANASGRNPACRRSGFAASATGLAEVKVDTPALCTGCRRLFINFADIPATGGARGHVYYHLAAANFTYTVGPVAHSPNTKNFTNDKLITPDGSLQEPIVEAFDTHATVYVADAAYFIHNAIQGPYYIGPWYLNRQGDRIDGVYLDVDVAAATSLGNSELDQIEYVDGFNSGEYCPTDADLLYGGCVDDWSFSASTVDPFS